MALFEQSWREDNRLSNYQGKRIECGTLDDSCGLNAAELQQQMSETFLEYLRPKMTWLIKKNYRGLHYYVCSNCKNEENYRAKFCPECGAKYEASY